MSPLQELLGALGRMTRSERVAAASVVLLAIGSIAPWLTVQSPSGQTSVEGLETDGRVTLTLAVVAAAVVYHRYRTDEPRDIGALLLCAGLALALCLDDMKPFGGGSSGLLASVAGFIHPGWGLVLCALASASLGASALAQHFS